MNVPGCRTGDRAMRLTALKPSDRSTVLEVFEVACDEVVGRGELGAQLREHRAQVQQAAAAAEKALPTPRPERDRPKSQVPAVSDETLEHAAAGKSDPFLQEVVAEVLARYDLRAGFDVAREERYARWRSRPRRTPGTARRPPAPRPRSPPAAPWPPTRCARPAAG